MKKIYKLAILSFSVLGIASCDLTMVPEDEVIPDRYFKTESDLMLWSNQFYRDILLSADWGSTTDLMMTNGISAYVSGNRTPQTQSWSFSALRDINYMLEHLDQCEDAAVATKYEALGRFFRAYFYFKMVRTYGDVPYYDKVLGSTDPDIYKARDSREYVMQRVLEDFEFAIQYLPGQWEEMNTRVTRWAAMGYASRAALYEGTFRKYHNIDDWEKYLEKTAEYAGEFISSAPFSLYSTGTTPYRDLFVSDNAITQEVVLCRHYDAANNVFHSMGYNAEFSRVSLTRRFLNHYLMANGQKFTNQDGWETKSYMEETQNRDPRMAQTVMCPGYIQKGASSVSPCLFTSHTGYQPIKFVPEASKCMSSSDDIDWCLLRAAEVYLNYAEAKAELQTLTQEDLDISVNLIRKRAGMPDLEMEEANTSPCKYVMECYPNVDKGPNKGVILEIRRERTVELALEQPDRSWDMFRWAECKQCLPCNVPWYGVYISGPGEIDTSGDGTADLEIVESGGKMQIKVGNTYTDIVLSEGDKGYITAYSAANYGTLWDDERDYLWPIPASQRILNPNLTQNPGYVDGVN